MLCRSGCPTACNLPFENGPGTLHGQTPVFHNTRNIVFGFGCALSARYAHKMCIRIMGLFELLEFVIFFLFHFSLFFFFFFGSNQFWTTATDRKQCFGYWNIEEIGLAEFFARSCSNTVNRHIIIIIKTHTRVSSTRIDKNVVLSCGRNVNSRAMHDAILQSYRRDDDRKTSRSTRK